MKENKFFICLFVMVLGVLFFTTCEKQHAKYEARWIITELVYKDTSLVNFLFSRNIALSTGKGNSTPIMTYEKFKNENSLYNDQCSFFYKHDRTYVVIQGSKFFTDTFEISHCLYPCCEITLENEDKYVELIYNGALGHSSRRRDCPYIKLRPSVR